MLKKELSWQAVYYHFRKWSRDGSLQRVWPYSIDAIRQLLNLSELNLDSSDAFAKKGGESVGYQSREKAKTTNILPITIAIGYIVASTGLRADNHNDGYDLTLHLQSAFHRLWTQHLSISIRGDYFTADAAFDTREARKTRFNQALSPTFQRTRATVMAARKIDRASLWQTFMLTGFSRPSARLRGSTSLRLCSFDSTVVTCTS